MAVWGAIVVLAVVGVQIAIFGTPFDGGVAAATGAPTVTAQPSNGPIGTPARSGSSPSLASSPPVLPAASRKVSVRSRGDQVTKPFELVGDYEVRISGSSGSTSTLVVVDLVPLSGAEGGGRLLRERLGANTGTFLTRTTILGLAGTYRLDATMPDTTWRVTFTRIP